MSNSGDKEIIFKRSGQTELGMAGRGCGDIEYLIMLEKWLIDGTNWHPRAKQAATMMMMLLCVESTL